MPGYLIRGRPHRLSCFFEKPQYERFLRHDLFQITRFTAHFLHLIGARGTCGVSRRALFALLSVTRTDGVPSAVHDVLGPFVVDAL
jgi:hypothetical protein